jgi:DNA segregation ATPase FtsK/SpoIIIE, S-DNA-T family
MAKVKGNRRLSGGEREKRSDASKSRAAPPRTGMARDIGAVLLLTLGVGLGLALTTFSALDGALVARGLSPANLVGPVGHRVAGACYQVLGFAALVVPVGLVTVAWRLFRGATGRLTAVGATAYLVLTLCLAVLSHLLLASFDLASFPAGGVIGAALAIRSVRLVSTAGSVLLVTAAALVAAIVATDLKIKDVVGLAWSGLLGLLGFTKDRMADAVREHREAVAELRAEEAAERTRRAEAEAEALAAAALVEADGEASADEARQVVGALALEQLNRRFGIDDPAWVSALTPLAPAAGEPQVVIATPALEDEPEPESAPRRRRKKGEERPADAVEAVEAAPEPIPPLAPSLLPPPPGRPEIVVSSAMLEERGKKKEKKKKDVPAFAFTKAGDVFRLPSTELLDQHEEKAAEVDTSGLTHVAEIIVATLKQHGVDGAIRHIRPGPVVTLYEFSPVAGVKLARIENLDKELTMALSAVRIRIIAPIPGKGVVGIEVPNKHRGTVFLRDILESETFGHAGGFLPLGLGKDIEGVPWCVDLQKMPHLLIAGTTGSGKSVGLNTMILSMLYRQTPAEVRMIMVDPKMTELSPYEDIPHLLLPVVTDPQKAARALQWAVDEMERRTQILADTGVRDLKSYNAKIDKLRTEGRTLEEADLLPPKKLVVVDEAAGETEEQAAARVAAEAAPGPVLDGMTGEPLTGTPEFEDPTAPPPADPVAARDEKRAPQKLPYIVVVIDELADLMLTAPREVETALARLAAKARATGIHLIVATQRPSTDVVTGTIKNNFPARISFRLGSRHDSATILNSPGAESLLGNGDMLVMTATQPITRVQGAFVSDDELHRVVGFLKEQGKPVYDDSILKARDGAGDSGRYDDEDDPVYDQAMEIVARMDEVSVSKLQREMRLGYNKAAKIIERMEREGLVGPANGVKPRQVLMRAGVPGEASAMPNL